MANSLNKVTTKSILDATIATADIAADAVTGAKIADDAIDSEHYTDGSIDTAHIADNAVSGAKMANGAVDTTQISDNAVRTAKINDENVTTSKLAADAVTGAKIADDAIGPEHIETLNGDVKFGDSGKLFLGAGDDLEIKHAGDHNYIWGNGANSGLTLGTNATTALSINTSQKASFTGEIALSSGGSERLNISSPGGGAILIKNPTAAHIAFGTNDTEEVRILNGGGITFNGDTAAANAIDDYEEGSWTPAVNSGTITGSGSYTKIGNIVNVLFYDGSLTGTRNSTTLQISGLPFTCATWTPGSMYAQVYNSEGSDQATIAAVGGETYFKVQEWGGEAIGTDFGNGYFVASVTYRVS